MTALGARERDLIDRLDKHGLKYPRTTVEEARRVGLPLSYALAFLEKESSGHDGDGPAFGLNCSATTLSGTRSRAAPSPRLATPSTCATASAGSG